MTNLVSYTGIERIADDSCRKLDSLRYIGRRLQWIVVKLAGAMLLLWLFAAPVAPVTGAEPQSPAGVIAVVNGETEYEDNGLCSLREAVANANQTNSTLMFDDCASGVPNGHDTIRLPVNGRFRLWDAVGPDYTTALPSIISAVTIEGRGATLERPADAGGLFRLLDVGQKGDVALIDVDLEGGMVEFWHMGGAINNRGALSITGGVLRHNTAIDSDGGAIYNEGVLTIDSVTFEHNNADDGGAIYNEMPFPPAPGGELTLHNSRLVTNSASYDGGALSGNRGIIVIEDSVIDGNEAGFGGGGLALSFTTITIRNTTISGNVAADSRGGGLDLNWSTLNLINSTVSGNEAYSGGGLNSLDDTINITGSTFTGNVAVTGGGIETLNSTLLITYSLISGNKANPYDSETNEVVGTYETTVTAYNVFGVDSEAGVDGFALDPSDVVPRAGVTLDEILDSTLADNGGPTFTHALPLGSPAIDVAPGDVCAEPPLDGLDQRGLPRNANGDGVASPHECDAGAYEHPPEAAVTFRLYAPFVRK